MLVLFAGCGFSLALDHLLCKALTIQTYWLIFLGMHECI